MKCSLMHKRVKVADIELDDASGFIKKINTVYAPEHLPIGVSIKKGVADRASLNDWWTERSIPASQPVWYGIWKYSWQAATGWRRPLRWTSSPGQRRLR